MAGLYFGSGIDKGFDNDLKRMNMQMNKLSGNVQKQGSKIDSTFKNVARTVGGFVSVMAIGAAGKELINFSKDLETALIEVATISTAVTDDFEGYKDAILELSTQSASSAKMLTDAFYDIVSAGYDGAQGLELLAAAERASTAGFVEVGVAADGLTTVLNAWGKSADQASSVSDVFFKTVEKGKTTFPELGANIAQVAPIAATLGVSFEEVSAAAATLTKSGTPTAQAFTQIRASLLAVNQVLGDGWSDIMTYQEALVEVERRSKGSTVELQAMLGRVEAVNAVLGLTGKNAIVAAQDLSAMNGALGATAIAAEKVIATTDQQVKILKNNILAALEPLADQAKGVLGELATSLNEAFQSGDIEKYAKILLQLGKAFLAYKVSVIAMNQVNKLRKAILLTNIKLQEQMRLEYALSGNTASKSALKMSVANKTLSRSFKTLTTAIKANPIGFLATAIIAILPLLQKLRDSMQKVDVVGKQMADITKEVASNLEKETTSLKVYQTQLQRTEPKSQERVKLIKQLNQEYPDLLKNIDGEESSIGELNRVFDSYIKNLEKTIRLKVLQSKFQDLINDRLEVEQNSDLSAGEKSNRLKDLQSRQKSLETELVYQKNIVDFGQRYADLIREQTNLLKEQAEGGNLAETLLGQQQTFEEFANFYRNVNPNATKEETEKAYLAEQDRQRELVIESEKRKQRLIEIENELQGELKKIRTKAGEGGLEITPEQQLDDLEIKHKQYINFINATYSQEESLQKQKQAALLKADLEYLNKKLQITTDELEKESIRSEIITKNQELKKLNIQEESSDDRLKQLEIEHQQKINELTLQYGKEKDMQKELNDALLKEELRYLRKKAEYTDDELEKERLKYEIIRRELGLETTDEKGEGKTKDDFTSKDAVQINQALSSTGDNINSQLADLASNTIEAFETLNTESSTTSDKISGIISLIIAAGQIIKDVVTNAFTETADEQGKINQQLANRITAETTINRLVRERQKMELESSAFLDANYKESYNLALKTLNDSEAIISSSIASLQGNLVLTATGTGESWLGINETAEQYSFTLAQILDQSDTLSGVDTGRIISNILDPADIFGGSASGDAYKDALDQVSKAFNSTLKDMGKTAADMANFSQQEWTDFYTILDEGGYIVDQGTKQLVTSLKEAQEQYTQALEEMKNIISTIAGDLGTALGDSIVNSIANGTDALNDFEKSLNAVFLEMAKAEMNALFFQGLFDELQEEMRLSMEGGDQNWQDDLLRFYDKLPSAIEGSEQFLRDFDRQLQELGFDGITGEGNKDLSTAGQIRQNITEETGTILAGHLGAVRLSNERIANYSEQMLDLGVQNLVTLNKIKENTDYLPEIAENTKKTAQKLGGF